MNPPRGRMTEPDIPDEWTDDRKRAFRQALRARQARQVRAGQGFALALVALIAFPLTASETKSTAGEKPAAPATEAAMKIHVDPATGQMVSPKSDPDAARRATPAGDGTAPPLPRRADT